jgi:hypothetical protein
MYIKTAEYKIIFYIIPSINIKLSSSFDCYELDSMLEPNNEVVIELKR